MDLNMPVKNGFDASQEIIQSDPEANIVALTAYQNAEEKCKRYGMKKAVTKPMEYDVLRKLVLKYCFGLNEEQI